MITPEQIPDEVVNALWLALLGRPLSAQNCRAAIAAAINAWQTQMHKAIVGKALDEVGGVYPAFILPLPQEPSA